MRTRPRKASDYDELPELSFEGVYVAGKEPLTRWDVYCKDGVVKKMTPHVSKDSETESEKEKEKEKDSHPDFLCASLCHPHIHLDKCFLLSHPKYADLEIETGDFDEAMRITSRSISCFGVFWFSFTSQRRPSLDLNTMISWSEEERSSKKASILESLICEPLSKSILRSNSSA